MPKKEHPQRSALSCRQESDFATAKSEVLFHRVMAQLWLDCAFYNWING